MVFTFSLMALDGDDFIIVSSLSALDKLVALVLLFIIVFERVRVMIVFKLEAFVFEVFVVSLNRSCSFSDFFDDFVDDFLDGDFCFSSFRRLCICSSIFSLFLGEQWPLAMLVLLLLLPHKFNMASLVGDK